MSDEARTGGVDPARFRRVIGRFVTGVTIATTTVDGVHHAMTVNSLTSVSLDPVLVLMCVDRAARFHAPVIASGEWAVSVLGSDGERASRWFARQGRAVHDQLDGWATSSAAAVHAAVFDGAIAVLECRTWATYDGGDHTIVVGEVVRADAPRRSPPPLTYFDGHYRDLAPRRPTGAAEE